MPQGPEGPRSGPGRLAEFYKLVFIERSLSVRQLLADACRTLRVRYDSNKYTITICSLTDDTDLSCGYGLVTVVHGLFATGPIRCRNRKVQYRTAMDVLFIGTDPVLEVVSDESCDSTRNCFSG